MADKERQLGFMPVDFTLLREFMRLPEGTRIVDVRVTERDMMRGRRSATFLIEHDDFPVTPDGMKLPEVAAEFTADDDGHPVFVNWKMV